MRWAVTSLMSLWRGTMILTEPSTMYTEWFDPSRSSSHDRPLLAADRLQAFSSFVLFTEVSLGA
jgi:hypothetical protein